MAPSGHTWMHSPQSVQLIWSIPAEGTGYDGTFALIFKGTKKLAACQKVIDVLGTQDFSALMAGIGYLTPRPACERL